LVLAFVVSKRTQANLLLERVGTVTDADIPFFISDHLAEYPAALLNANGQWVCPCWLQLTNAYPAKQCWIKRVA
jgi:hypothetical protein